MLFVEVAEVSTAVAQTTGRNEKAQLLASALRRLVAGAAGDAAGAGGADVTEEIEAGAAFLSGELRQRQTGVGWAALQDLPPAAQTPTLRVRDVDAAGAALAAVAGPGAQARRRELVRDLFGAATGPEQELLRGLFGGDVRQGAGAGVLTEAVARAAGVPLPAVRRALLLAGDLPRVARAALTGGTAALAAFRLEPGRALSPMLAASASDGEEALAQTGVPAVADTKLDGVRIQVHIRDDGTGQGHPGVGQIAVFSRGLADITDRLPEVVAAVRELPVRAAVLDGEALALDAHGRPLPFQDTSGRAATRQPAPGAPQVPAEVRLTPSFFDLLHLDGEDLLDRPLSARVAALAEVVPAHLRVTRTPVSSGEEVAQAVSRAVADGQEGVVVKALGAGYDAGRRGGAWVKVKPRHTLDLVVLAAEWGHGRRHGWLSNLHLGARDSATGEFVMLGKTFKGLTDALLRWQTQRLQELAVAHRRHVVHVRPELVVEVAFDGVQRSSRYPGGVTLRFARVVRYREDKPASDADTLATVRAIGGQPTGGGEASAGPG